MSYQANVYNVIALLNFIQSDLPPPPPELIDDEEPPRASFGSSGPGPQSKTFKMLQESIGNDHSNYFVSLTVVFYHCVVTSHSSIFHLFTY